MRSVRRRVAIVGAGPSGLYALERLLKTDPEVEVDLFDRAPTPLGLIRYGVAPDHQSTKGVARVLERGLNDPRTQFHGGVEIGRDLTLDQLSIWYDAVILATGAGRDRKLGVPGEELGKVVGSGRFTAWINRRIDAAEAPLDFSGVRRVVLIGAGNVALDVARLLLRPSSEFEGSDLCPEVEAAFANGQIDSVEIVARGPVSAARFGPIELREVLGLPDLAVHAEPAVDEAEPIGLAARDRREGARLLGFRFGLTPVAFEGEGEVRLALFRDSSGREVALTADLVVTCIGFEAAEVCSAPAEAGRLSHQDNVIRPGVYVTGWAGKGAQGTIPTARADAHALVDRLLAETEASARPGRSAANEALAEAGIAPFDAADWRRIDAAEKAQAGPGRARRKFTTVADMRAAAVAPLD
jgi:ferredoxin--NADP+ reductase